jgi:transcriptional regulator with XRE-family HTH domain
MKITNALTDLAILEELGTRLARQRIDAGLTQAALATEAGVSKRTVERIEGGGTSELVTLIRLLRILKLNGGFEALIPDSPASPIALLKNAGKPRRRASTRRAHNLAAPRAPWSWAE